MELERVIPTINRRVNGEKIAEYCRRLADVLVDKKWHLDDVLGAHIQREIKKIVVLSERIGPAELKSARTVTVTADFWADKDEADFDEDDLVTKYEPYYKVRAALSEEVDSTELPGWVLESLRHQSTFQKKRRMDGDLIDNDEEPELDQEMLDAFMYEKKTAMHYVLDDDGWIQDYGVECEYACNGHRINSREYSWSANAVEDISDFYGELTGQERDEGYEPVTYESPGKLTDAEVAQFGLLFDEVMSQIIQAEEAARVDEAFERFEEAERKQSEAEEIAMHHARAFGMLALNAARFIGMRMK